MEKPKDNYELNIPDFSSKDISVNVVVSCEVSNTPQTPEFYSIKKTKEPKMWCFCYNTKQNVGNQKFIAFKKRVEEAAYDFLIVRISDGIGFMVKKNFNRFMEIVKTIEKDM